MYCPECETVGNDGDHCGYCGTKTVFSKFPCPHCKAPNWVTTKFCEHCGKPVQEDAKMFVEEQIKKGGK